MSTRRTPVLVALLSLLSLMCSCPLGLPLSPGGDVSPEARAQVLADVQASAQSLPGEDLRAERKALLEQLQAH